MKSGNQYVIGVKTNQPNLYRHIERVTGAVSTISGAYTDMKINRGESK